MRVKRSCKAIDTMARIFRDAPQANADLTSLKYEMAVTLSQHWGDCGPFSATDIELEYNVSRPDKIRNHVAFCPLRWGQSSYFLAEYLYLHYYPERANANGKVLYEYECEIIEVQKLILEVELKP